MLNTTTLREDNASEEIEEVKPSKTPWIVLGMVIALIAAVFAVSLAFKKKPVTPYTAVFLTNGQVYIGKATVEKDTTVLSNIYYFNTASSSQVSLVKMGDEIYGPEDSMTVLNSNILYYQALKNDSQVVKTIEGK